MIKRKQTEFEKQILKLIKFYHKQYNWNGKRRKNNGK